VLAFDWSLFARRGGQGLSRSAGAKPISFSEEKETVSLSEHELAVSGKAANGQPMDAKEKDFV